MDKISIENYNQNKELWHQKNQLKRKKGFVLIEWYIKKVPGIWDVQKKDASMKFFWD